MNSTARSPRTHTERPEGAKLGARTITDAGAGTDDFTKRTTLETALRFLSSTHQFTFWQCRATYFQIQVAFSQSAQ